MKKPPCNSFGIMIVALLIQLLLFPKMSSTQTTIVSNADGVISLLKSKAEQPATMEQFVRLLPAAFGFGDSISYKLDRDSLLTSLLSLGVIPEDVTVDFNKPLTKGRVSVVLIKSMRIEKGSLLEKLMISLFKSQEACFRVALREKLIPAGDTEDMVTSKELAAIMLAVAVLNISNPLPQADRHCIELFAETIIKNGIIGSAETREILDLVDPSAIKSILAL